MDRGTRAIDSWLGLAHFKSQACFVCGIALFYPFPFVAPSEHGMSAHEVHLHAWRGAARSVLTLQPSDSVRL